MTNVLNRKSRRQAVITDPEQEGLVNNDEGPMTQSGSHDYLSFMKETGRLEDVNTYQPANSWSQAEPNSSTRSTRNINTTSSADTSRNDYEQIKEQQLLSLTSRSSSSSKGASSNRSSMRGWRSGKEGE